MHGMTVIEVQFGVMQSLLEQVQNILPYARAIVNGDRRWIVCGGPLPAGLLDAMPGVRLIHTREPYPLASLAITQARTAVQVGPWAIGGGQPVIMAGPCSVESRDQLLETATYLAARGCHILRGGAFKPRTSPYSFQGLGPYGLELLAEARSMTGLPFVTEVLAPGDVELVASYADMLQVGARNMQNFPLLREVGKSGKPVLLKRGPWANLSTWLQAAEYILAEGNFKVVLCERGICVSEASSGKHLDLAAVLRLRKLTHLPVIVDPSHGTGERALVTPMAMAAVAVGADGLMVEIHPEPEEALSDGGQSLTLPDFDRFMEQIARISAALEQPAVVV